MKRPLTHHAHTAAAHIVHAQEHGINARKSHAQEHGTK